VFFFNLEKKKKTISNIFSRRVVVIRRGRTLRMCISSVRTINWLQFRRARYRIYPQCTAEEHVYVLQFSERIFRERLAPRAPCSIDSRWPHCSTRLNKHKSAFLINNNSLRLRWAPFIHVSIFVQFSRSGRFENRTKPSRPARVRSVLRCYTVVRRR